MRSYLIRIEGLGGGDSYTGLPAFAFRAGYLGYAPTWNGNDAWPVFCEEMDTCLDTGTPQLAEGNTSKTSYPDSYVVDRVWVSNTAAPLRFDVAFFSNALLLPVRLARLTLDLNDPSSQGAGMLSGVVRTQELIDELSAMAGNISTTLCSGPTLDSVTQQFAAASDIMDDGTQDANATCNGISIGLGFNARPALVGAVLDAQPIPPDPCLEQ